MFEPVLHGSEPVEGDGLAVPAAGSSAAAAAMAEPEPELEPADATSGGELAEGVPYEEAPPLPQAPDGAYVIDRDAGSWRHVVNYLRARRPRFKNGVRIGSAADEVILPDSKAELRQLAADAKWYVLDELETMAQTQLAETQAREDKIARLEARVYELEGALKVTLEISGATGSEVLTEDVNGVFRRTGSVFAGFAVYQKVTDPTVSIWRAEKSGWWVGLTENLGEARGFAYLHSDAVGPETIGKNGAQWRVIDGNGDWRDAPNLNVLAETDPIALQATQVAELSTKLDVVLLGPIALKISGATGINRDGVNGVFRRTGIVSGGFAVYEKTTNTSNPKVSIWRVEGSGKWIVGSTESIGQDRGFATLRSDTVAPETLGKDGVKWQVAHTAVHGDSDSDAGGWKVNNIIKVLWDAEVIVEQATQIDAVERALAALNLEISGATGPNNDIVNGVFRRTGVVSGGFAVYEKTTNANYSIWRAEESGKWFVSSTELIGQDRGFATLRSDTVAPETRGKNGAQWQVAHGNGDWRDEPNVRVRCV
jgi:hypothetical protein